MRWTKQIPGLLRRIELAELGFRGRFSNVVVDFATGLMWESSCSRAMKQAEVESANIEDIGGRGGWRLPSLLEAFSLLPNSVSAYTGYSQTYQRSEFDRWENIIWTSDNLRGTFGQQPLACTYNDSKLAYPLEYACIRLVRDFC